MLYITEWHAYQSQSRSPVAGKLFRASDLFRHHLLRPPRPFSPNPSHGPKRPCGADAMRRYTLVPVACLLLDARPFSRSCRGPSRAFGLGRIHPRLQTTLRLCVSQILPPPSLGNELLRPYSPALGPDRGCRLLHLVESRPQEALRTSARISFLRQPNHRLDQTFLGSPILVGSVENSQLRVVAGLQTRAFLFSFSSLAFPRFSFRSKDRPLQGRSHGTQGTASKIPGSILPAAGRPEIRDHHLLQSGGRSVYRRSPRTSPLKRRRQDVT